MNPPAAGLCLLLPAVIAAAVEDVLHQLLTANLPQTVTDLGTRNSFNGIMEESQMETIMGRI